MSKAKLYIQPLFCSVFNKASQSIPEYDATEQCHNFLSSFTITAEADVFEALTQLDTSKVVGIDGIGPRIPNCATTSIQLSGLVF